MVSNDTPRVKIHNQDLHLHTLHMHIIWNKKWNFKNRSDCQTVIKSHQRYQVDVPAGPSSATLSRARYKVDILGMYVRRWQWGRDGFKKKHIALCCWTFVISWNEMRAVSSLNFNPVQFMLFLIWLPITANTYIMKLWCKGQFHWWFHGRQSQVSTWELIMGNGHMTKTKHVMSWLSK